MNRLMTVYYGNPITLYKCPQCENHYKYEAEYSEDGPGNVSSEKWIIFERIDKGEAEELKKWNFPR